MPQLVPTKDWTPTSTKPKWGPARPDDSTTGAAEAPGTWAAAVTLNCTMPNPSALKGDWLATCAGSMSTACVPPDRSPSPSFARQQFGRQLDFTVQATTGDAAPPWNLLVDVSFDWPLGFTLLAPAGFERLASTPAPNVEDAHVLLRLLGTSRVHAEVQVEATLLQRIGGLFSAVGTAKSHSEQDLDSWMWGNANSVVRLVGAAPTGAAMTIAHPVAPNQSYRLRFQLRVSLESNVGTAVSTVAGPIFFAELGANAGPCSATAVLSPLTVSPPPVVVRRDVGTVLRLSW